MKDFMNKHKVVVLLLILVLAVFFRLYNLGETPPGLYPDEAMNGNNALEALETGEYKVFYTDNNGREGLYINLVALSLDFFGNYPWALRLVSALFGIFTVLGLYLLTKEIFRKESIALFASFLIATSFWHINFSRIGFRAIMSPFFLVWGAWLVWKIINYNQKKLQWGAVTISIVAGFIFGLGFHSYIAYRVAPLILIPPLILLLKARRFNVILLFCLGMLISIAPLMMHFLDVPEDFFGRTSQISIFSLESPILELGKNVAKTVGMFFWYGDFNWRHNYSGASQLWLPIAFFFFWGLFISASKLFSKNSLERSIHWFLMIWLVVMLLPVVVSAEGIPHALRAIIIIPVVMIFASLGLDKFFKKLPNKLAVFLIFVLAITTTLQTYNQYFIKWAKEPEVATAFNQNHVEVSNFINSLPENTSKYVIIGADGVDVRGFPMPSQSVMFLTKTFLPKWQKEKNIFYLLPNEIDLIPERSQKIWIK